MIAVNISFNVSYEIFSFTRYNALRSVEYQPKFLSHRPPSKYRLISMGLQQYIQLCKIIYSNEDQSRIYIISIVTFETKIRRT
jgi:hypothetical protein